jgi:hypothetical protein
MNTKEINKTIKTGAKEILKQRKDISEKFTDDKIAEMCIDNVWKKEYGPQKVKENIMPGVHLGYGGEEQGGYGSGPTRFIANANYALRSTYTIEDVKLTKGIFNRQSDELASIVEGLITEYSNDNPKIELQHSTGPKTKYDSQSKSNCKALATGSLNINNNGTHNRVVISHVRKKDGQLVGDISFHTVRLLGTGGSFYPKKQAYTKEDTNTFHSIRTSELYNPSRDDTKPTSEIFKQKIESERRGFFDRVREYNTQISNIAGKTHNIRKYDMITVYNL